MNVRENNSLGTEYIIKKNRVGASIHRNIVGKKGNDGYDYKQKLGKHVDTRQ